jgi:glutamine synthetase
MSDQIAQFFREHNIQEVEAIVPDMAGIARGKVIRARAAESEFRQAMIHAVRNVRQEASDLHHRRRAHPHRGLKTA